MNPTSLANISTDATFTLFGGLLFLAFFFWYLATEKEVKKRNLGSILVAALAVGSFLAIVPPTKIGDLFGEKAGSAHNLQGGIELVGGTSFIMRVEEGVDPVTLETLPVTKEAMETAKQIVEKRLNQMAVTDAPITIQGDNLLEIQMPGITPQQAKEVSKQITQIARLTFHKSLLDPVLAQQILSGDTAEPGVVAGVYESKDRNGNITSRPIAYQRKAHVTGKDVKAAQPDRSTNNQVLIELHSTGAKKMKTFTRSLRQNVDQIVTVLDGKIVNSATLNAESLGKNFVITGLDDLEECVALSNALVNPLENPLVLDEQRTVSATLGDATIKQGINAGLAGLALTVVFILLYYRFAGFIALAGLILNVLILFGAMALFGASFTLPGIAGIILTIGVAVDANVLIYERLREEMARGKSVRAAIEAAYEKAFAAIFDANITTLITALILFWKASGTIKGFAVTLTIGILGTLLAALLCTRVLFWWASHTGTLKKLSFMNLIPNRSFDFLSKRKAAFSISIVAIIAGLGILGVKGDKSLGTDFTGGTIMRFDIPEGQTVEQTQVSALLNELTLGQAASAQIEAVPGSQSFVKVTMGSKEEDLQAAEDKLRESIPGFSDTGANGEFIVQATRDTVSATLGGQFLSNAIWALVFGLFGILIYITLRFEFSFAVGAFFALSHDILACIGILALKGDQFTLIHVGAFLTIAGYSINDTIVVFDRIRESLKTAQGDVKDVMNQAISATLSRTILTSATTFASVLLLYVFGGAALKDFSFTIMVGVLVGTYSSIFIAAPIVYILAKRRGTNLRGEVLDANLQQEIDNAVAQGAES